MLKSIFWKTVWERRKSFAFWSLGIFLYTVMMSALYDSMEGFEEFGNIMEEMPEVMQALMGEIGDITTPAGFLGAEIYSLTLPIVLAIFAIGYGASLLSKEEDSGTLELLLASPIKRSSVIVQKMAALICSTALLSLTVWIGISLTTLAMNFDIGLVNVFWASLASGLLALCFGLLAFAVTSGFARRGRAIAIATVVFIWSYFATTAANLLEGLEWMRYTSLLHYYDGQNILTEGVAMEKFSVLIMFIVIMSWLSITLFKKRDTGS